MRARALLVMLLLGLLVGGLGGGSLARAESYPPLGVRVVAGTLSASSVGDGGAVTLSGGGFRPGTALQLTLDGAVKGTAKANSVGKFSSVFVVRGAGLHALAATGLEPGGRLRVVTANVTVTQDADAAAGGGGLPTTGAYVAMALLGGFGLVALGSTVLLLARSRRRHHLVAA